METIVHIIIPVFNCEKYIESCLLSCLNQSFKPFDIVCINDGSTDRSLEILLAYSNKYDFIKVFSQSNLGVSAARNYGLNVIDNNGYVTFLDADDCLECDFLKSFVDCSTDNPDIIYYNNPKNGTDKKGYILGQLLWESPRGPVRKLIKTTIAKSCLFDVNYKYSEDLIFNFDICVISNSFALLDYQEDKYIVNNKTDSLTREPVTQARIIDSFLSWYYVYRLLEAHNFYNDTDIYDLVCLLVCNEFLECFGALKTKNYKYNQFIDAKNYLLKQKLFKKIKPINQKHKLKNDIYLYFRPIYKMARALFKSL